MLAERNTQERCAICALEMRIIYVFCICREYGPQIETQDIGIKSGVLDIILCLKRNRYCGLSAGRPRETAAVRQPWQTSAATKGRRPVFPQPPDLPKSASDSPIRPARTLPTSIRVARPSPVPPPGPAPDGSGDAGRCPPLARRGLAPPPRATNFLCTPTPSRPSLSLPVDACNHHHNHHHHYPYPRLFRSILFFPPVSFLPYPSPFSTSRHARPKRAPYAARPASIAERDDRDDNDDDRDDDASWRPGGEGSRQRRRLGPLSTATWPSRPRLHQWQAPTPFHPCL